MLRGMQFRKDYYQFDPNEKTVGWADRLITEFRGMMLPLVLRKRSIKNKNYLYGTQPVEKYKKKFHKPDELPFEFEPLKVFEKYRNILLAEREKAGIYLQLNAIDPSAKKEQEKDRKLLEGRSTIEGIMNYTDLSIGRAPYNLMKDTDPDGEKLFNGNVEQFDEMGLNPKDPEDVSYFFQNFFRLDAEISAEDIVNYYVKLHELAEHMKGWWDEILANKAVAGRVYHDEYTMGPVYEEHDPTNVYWIKGKRQDGKDAKALCIMENITVHDLLGKIGSAVTPAQMDQILKGVNYIGNTTYDGIAFSDGSVYGENCNNRVQYDEFLTMKVHYGYIEWKSVDAKVTKEGYNSEGLFRRYIKDYAYLMKKAERSSSYSTQSVFAQNTYTAYFLATSSGTQEVFKFGKLFDQVTEGPENEYSNYSIQLYVAKGPSAVEVHIPHNDNIQDAWFRFNWILNKAKPRGTRWNFDVIAKIATRIYKDDPEQNAVTKVIADFNEAIDDMYVADSNASGGGGQNPHFDKPNGLDPAIKDFYEVIKNQQMEIGEKLGVNAAREAYSPSPNDGYKLQMQMLAQSRNATEYMSRMVMSILVNYAKHTLSIVQDIIEFEGSKAYKFLQRAVGSQAILSLKALKKIPLHKYGIFVESFNTDLERQEVKQITRAALERKEIPMHVYLLINTVDNYKKASQILSYELRKAEKKKEQEQNKANQAAMALEQAKHKFKMEQINAQQQGDLGVQQKQNEGIIKVAELNNQTKIEVKQIGIENEPAKNENRTDNKIREKAAQRNLDLNQPADGVTNAV